MQDRLEKAEKQKGPSLGGQAGQGGHPKPATDSVTRGTQKFYVRAGMCSWDFSCCCVTELSTESKCNIASSVL